ncbi:sodium:solute symporter [Parabacteroides gordonii]|uniref:sodium:solute symporter n=1 Tax=Parabacteroides gordonii TaxID=574930 RepID=UPI0026ED6D8A|nr:sodium:solute symporter [Parabacteroides gordonii]
MELSILDFIVFFAFMAGTLLFGCSFFSKNRNSNEYTSAGGRLPAWVVGMSIFATYVSSISFLALPGNAYMGNWNPFVFSLSIPIASWIAAKYFVPFYRNINSISAYSYLEERFGYWARVYASCCYLLTQVARIGSVLYLMALPLHSMLGWSIPVIIMVSGLCVVIYSVLGGITAVIWTDAIQGIVLIAGALACVIVLLFSMPEGPSQLFSIAKEYDKFSLGSFGPDLGTTTFWVTLVYGLFINLQNYGIDQNYVQRYKTAKDDKGARSAALFGGLLYVPVSMFFFFIGTALFAYYTASPELLPEGTANDAVFPYFIVHGLPTGITGLLIAAICAAGMSTVSTSINSSATIILTDFFQHKRKMTDKQNMYVLYVTSFILGVLGMGLGLAMMSVQSALEAWWSLAAIFSGGMLGLFLLGYMVKRVKSIHAMIGVVCGVILIAWMSFGNNTVFHSYLTIVFGTILIFLVGFLLSLFAVKQRNK